MTVESKLSWTVVAVLLGSLGCKAERVPLATELGGAGEPSRLLLTSLQAGPARETEPRKNPFAENAHAVQKGKRYYEWFNCAGCHGALGGGSMGPPLADADWIYGGEPENLRDSILKGRPNGMPAYEGRLAEDVVWQVVAYVQSLGGAEGDDRPEGTPVSGPAEDAQGDEGAADRANE